MKGIVLAGGSGTRLCPITEGVSKQLLPIYDKPMVYYPISVLMLAGIKDILIITTPHEQPNFMRALGDGSKFGINLSYVIQPTPDGLAQAFILGEEFIGKDTCALVLGDNIFYGNGLVEELREARENAEKGKATIFGYQVKDPERFGVMELDENKNVLSVEEKPKEPKSDFAITGLYFYDNTVVEKAKKVMPSARGELEITDLNRFYLEEGKLKACLLGGGYTWFDTGTFDSLLEAANMIKAIQNNKGRVISCLEQIAYNNGWLTLVELNKRAELLKKNSYGEYLKSVSEKANVKVEDI
jgi:glucose-1-phosphate thymidylyltransferase